MKEVTVHSHIGPGGWKCPCCGPAPHYRKSFKRLIKRRIRNKVRKDIEESVLTETDKENLG